jgi:uncharacterized protein YbjT (DUF2867 family)
LPLHWVSAFFVYLYLKHHIMIANIIGATGLTGKALLHQLLADERFTEVRAFGRRPPGITHRRLRVVLIDFDQPASWADQVSGDVLFSCLGTTMKQAGSKEAQYQVDYTYQYAFAKAAADNGVPVYVLVSSVGANAQSAVFYSQMKGALDEAVSRLPFRSISIIRPGFLEGRREVKRLGESIGLALMQVVGKIPLLGSWRPIPGGTVARAMINAAVAARPGLTMYTLGDVFTLAGKQ